MSGDGFAYAIPALSRNDLNLARIFVLVFVFVFQTIMRVSLILNGPLLLLSRFPEFRSSMVDYIC